MRNYHEISHGINELYRAGIECMQLTGEDTRFAPARYALEWVIGEQDSVMRPAGASPVGKPDAPMCIVRTEDVIRAAIANCEAADTEDAKMAITALKWVLNETNELH